MALYALYAMYAMYGNSTTPKVLHMGARPLHYTSRAIVSGMFSIYCSTMVFRRHHTWSIYLSMKSALWVLSLSAMPVSVMKIGML